MTFLFAINPVSGGLDKDVWETAIDQHFANSPHTAHRLHLNGHTDHETLRQNLTSLKPDRVVAVGGDGTIKFVAGHLLNTTIPLGILPAGSANGMARELALPTNVNECVQLLTSGTPRPVDVISINEGDICLHLSDIGLNAQLVKHYEQNNLRGKLGYLRGVFYVLRKHRQLRLTIDIGNTSIQRVAFMVVLANARMYGTGAVINPDGNLSDGKFEVVVFRRLSFWQILKLFWRYQPFDPEQIEIFPAKAVTIEAHRRAYFQVDGEYRGRVDTLTARIQPNALTILVPPDVKP